MTHRVGPKGQVVIPKELRNELGIEPGDEVSFCVTTTLTGAPDSGPAAVGV